MSLMRLVARVSRRREWHGTQHLAVVGRLTIEVDDGESVGGHTRYVARPRVRVTSHLACGRCGGAADAMHTTSACPRDSAGVGHVAVGSRGAMRHVALGCVALRCLALRRDALRCVALRCARLSRMFSRRRSVAALWMRTVRHPVCHPAPRSVACAVHVQSPRLVRHVLRCSPPSPQACLLSHVRRAP